MHVEYGAVQLETIEKVLYSCSLRRMMTPVQLNQLTVLRYINRSREDTRNLQEWFTTQQMFIGAMTFLIGTIIAAFAPGFEVTHDSAAMRSFFTLSGHNGFITCEKEGAKHGNGSPLCHFARRTSARICRAL